MGLAVGAVAIFPCAAGLCSFTHVCGSCEAAAAVCCCAAVVQRVHVRVSIYGYRPSMSEPSSEAWNLRECSLPAPSVAESPQVVSSPTSPSSVWNLR